MSVDEREWWDGLEGQAILDNTAGVPPYDATAVAKYLIEVLQLQPGDRVLDLGCGTGRLTNEIATRRPGARFVGVDIAPSLIDLAMAEAPPNAWYRIGDGRALPDHIGMFDGAYSITMFQHIPHDAVRGYLADVAAHLRSESLFMFTVAVGTEDSFLNHQVDLDLLRRWVEDAGLSPIASRRTEWTWFLAVKP
jgi:cyclopropane fatty-acyl-phospholipid synthase-like methyltransferase